MKKLAKLLAQHPFSVMVSLPKNDPALAKAAIAGGAEAFKVHLRITHDASGTRFGTLKEEKKNLEEILKLAGDRPVGIVPGNKANPVTKDEIKTLVKMGIDYVDLYASDYPDWLWKEEGLSKMVAIQEAGQVGKIESWVTQGAEFIEAAIVPHDGYGKRMNIGDLQNYLSLANSSKVPVIVPTQRNILAEELPALWDTGVKAILIGAIVTGQTAESIEEATKAFIAMRDQFIKEPELT